MRQKSLTYEQEVELYGLLEQRRALSNKKLMARFKVSAWVLYRIATEGPRVPRETSKKVRFEEALEELRT